MATLAHYMLDAIERLGAVYYGVAGSGSTDTQIVDTKLDQGQWTYTEAPLWILSGDHAGKCVEITKHTRNTLEFSTLTTAIASGDEYAVAKKGLFPYMQVKAAVLRALRSHPIMLKDTSLTTVDDQYRYTLPDGVNDVRRIAYVEDDQYKILYDWHELPGEIEFYVEPEADLSLVLFYAGVHPWIEVTEQVQGRWNVEAVAWGAVVNLYRNYISKFKKDNPTALELFNEAKLLEMEESRTYMQVPALLTREGRYRHFGV